MASSFEQSFAALLKLLSFLFWCGSYFWCIQNIKNRSPEWYSRIVTLLHGSLATVIGLNQCDVYTISRRTLTDPITVSQYLLMLWSWGYFAFDFIWCLVYWPYNYVILGHHITALYAVNSYMNKCCTGCTFACTMVVMEITNPLLQLRWLMRDAGYGSGYIFKLVEISYLILFLSLRGILCTYLMYKISQSDMFDLEEKLLSLALYVVSIVFVYEIIGYVAYKYKNRIEEFRGFANEVGAILNETI